MMFMMANFWPIAAVLLTGVSGLILLSSRPKWRDYLSFSLIVGFIVTAWVILHPRQTPLMDDARKVQAMIGNGIPVLLEFQSPY